MNAGHRYRLVTTVSIHGKLKQHVSSVVLGESEVLEHLDLEEELHSMSGWTVTQLQRDSERYPWLLCWNGSSKRTIEARAYGPMEDA